MTWSEAGKAALAGTVLLLLAAGCGHREASGFRLAGATSPGLELPGPGETRSFEAAGERRPSLVLPVAGWSWEGTVPPDATFSAGAAVVPAAGMAAPELEVRAEIATGSEREVLDLGRGREGGWIDLQADLSRYAGRRARLSVVPRLAGEGSAAGIAWSHGRVGSRAARAPARPNVLLVVVDTLRADHLTSYGYARATSPHVEELLSRRGVVVETAYSQAPWTVPSVASFLTGRYPGEILQGPMEGYAIPAAVPTLAERLSGLGYDTAAFYGNFVLRDANGFGRGFATRYTPPAVPESNLLHADSVNRRAIPWLASHQDEPFFLYVHYMDPHDPYDNPEVVGGKSPFFPEYTGSLSGQWVHGVYTGGIPLADPEQDVKHLTALYDTEIHYVDRAIGELLSHLEPAVAANTLVVLTADHGEELYDHGGWKHGQTLYQEQIHVPLVFRWDGHLPAGKRLAGTVQLLDLVPTLLATVGAPEAPELQGASLLAALRGEAPLPKRPAFAQHLASGPLRAALIAEGKKLIELDREAPFVPPNALIDHLWRLDRQRMARQELYDLGADPAEKHNLATAKPELARALEPGLAEHLDRVLPGLRLVVSGLPPGRHLSGRIRFDRPPSEGAPILWQSLFLSAADRVQIAGDELSFDWSGDEPGAGPGEKGILLPGELGDVVELRAEAEGQGEPLVLLTGNGAPYRGGRLAMSDLSTSTRPRPGSGPTLRLWRRSDATTTPGSAAVDAEVEKSLRALGYIQ